ncbi:MAG: dodecin [Pseudoclavibacter sp.]
MSTNTYQITEIVGTSPDGVDSAIRNGLARAGKTLRHLEWFEAGNIRGQIGPDGDVAYFQVELRVGFRIEDPEV